MPDLTCPTCGQPLAARPDPNAIVKALLFSPDEWRVLAPLAADFGATLPRQKLINRAFGRRDERTKAKLSQKLSSTLLALNRKLTPRGLIIEHMRVGSRAVGHRLVFVLEQLMCEACGALYPADSRARICRCGGRLVSQPVYDALKTQQAA